MNQEELLEIYNKFPAVLRNKLINKEIALPDETQFEYEKFLAFRGIVREPGDSTPLNKDDMRSYYELDKKPRGGQRDDKNPSSYSVSLFRAYDDIAAAFHFPKPRKRLAQGYVHAEGGPQYCSTSDSHVDWWLYENVDLSSFKIREDLNE